MKRHHDALAIQGGACNPIAIVNSIRQAIEEIRTETGALLPTDTILTDPATRLMVHQLAFLFHIDRIDNGTDSYSDLMTACEVQP
jgi:hypothetical protein